MMIWAADLSCLDKQGGVEKKNQVDGKVVLEGCVSWPLGYYTNKPGVSSRNLLETTLVDDTWWKILIAWNR